MSKKFKNKPCAYCLKNLSTTGDHVFAREFFMEDKRDDLPKVPACLPCNNEKSRLEHYLATVLPFGGRHPDASTNLAASVPDRLARNVRLHRELAEGSERAVMQDETGPACATLTIPLDGEKLERLFHFIVRGLAFHHWGVSLGDEHDTRVMILTETGVEAFSLLLQEAPASGLAPLREAARFTMRVCKTPTDSPYGDLQFMAALPWRVIPSPLMRSPLASAR